MASTDTTARPVFLLVCTLVAFAIAAHARVFTRTPATDDLAGTFAACGGRLLYESAVTVNDAPGELAIFGIADAPATAIPLLRQALGTDALESGAALAQAVITREHAVVRLVLAQPDPDGPTVAFTLRQTPDAYHRSATPPAARALAGVPPYPGATPSFYATDARAGGALSVVSTGSEATDVHAFYAREFSAAGWQPLLPSASRDAMPTGLAVHVRGDELCLLLVSDGAATGRTTITLLHKHTGMK